jgi:hypothetical protein
VDIGVHPPLPDSSHTTFILAVTVFILAFFFSDFQVPNFQGHFEALNDVFLDFWGDMGFLLLKPTPNGSCNSWICLIDKVSNS